MAATFLAKNRVTREVCARWGRAKAASGYPLLSPGEVAQGIRAQTLRVSRVFFGQVVIGHRLLQNL